MFTRALVLLECAPRNRGMHDLAGAASFIQLEASYHSQVNRQRLVQTESDV